MVGNNRCTTMRVVDKGRGRGRAETTRAEISDRKSLDLLDGSILVSFESCSSSIELDGLGLGVEVVMGRIRVMRIHRA
eukprot:879570-Amorphochlora_amoeboformis.AAC.1